MSKPTRLDETIAMMLDDDFTVRLKAEYYQLKIRQNALENQILRLESDGHTDDVVRIYRLQYSVMDIYAEILEQRATAIGIRF